MAAAANAYVEAARALGARDFRIIVRHIMPNCMALGQAAGTAAALCVKTGVTPRKLDTGMLRRSLLDQGAII